MACLVGAGIMYNHFPGDKAALTDPSPTRKYSMRAPAAYGSPRCKPSCHMHVQSLSSFVYCQH